VQQVVGVGELEVEKTRTRVERERGAHSVAQARTLLRHALARCARAQRHCAVRTRVALDLRRHHLAASLHPLLHLTTDWRNGPNTRLLCKRSRVRFPHRTHICVHDHACLYWVWAFSMYNVYVFTKLKVYKHVYLSVI
jgi:hypothetical protein